jgi:hypothetical protein
MSFRICAASTIEVQKKERKHIIFYWVDTSFAFDLTCHGCNKKKSFEINFFYPKKKNEKKKEKREWTKYRGMFHFCADFFFQRRKDTKMSNRKVTELLRTQIKKSFAEGGGKDKFNF